MPWFIDRVKFVRKSVGLLISNTDPCSDERIDRATIERAGEAAISVPGLGRLQQLVTVELDNARSMFIANSADLPQAVVSELADLADVVLTEAQTLLAWCIDVERVSGSTFRYTHRLEAQIFKLERRYEAQQKYLRGAQPPNAEQEAASSSEDHAAVQKLSDGERVVLRVLLESKTMLTRTAIIERLKHYAKNRNEKRYGEHVAKNALQRLNTLGFIAHSGDRSKGWTVTEAGLRFAKDGDTPALTDHPTITR